MACRGLLLKLEARGYLRLPPRVTASVNRLRNCSVGHLEHDQRPIEGPPECLGPIRLEAVAEGTTEALLWLNGAGGRFEFTGQVFAVLGGAARLRCSDSSGDEFDAELPQWLARTSDAPTPPRRAGRDGHRTRRNEMSSGL